MLVATELAVEDLTEVAAGATTAPLAMISVPLDPPVNDEASEREEDT